VVQQEFYRDEAKKRKVLIAHKNVKTTGPSCTILFSDVENKSHDFSQENPGSVKFVIDLKYF
jgi:hypothetical protein